MSSGLVVYLIMVVNIVVDEVHAPRCTVSSWKPNEFFKCTPSLEKPLGPHDQEGEMVMCTERITVEMRQK